MTTPFRSIRGTTSAVDAFLPRVLPARWLVVETRDDGRAYLNAAEGLSAILAVEHHPHPETGATDTWLHLSIARRDRMPTWTELTEARDLFLGPGTEAYQKLPKRSEHVNIHPYCLHLWALVNRPLTPDFTRGSGSL
jgi:hypothetical protein